MRRFIVCTHSDVFQRCNADVVVKLTAYTTHFTSLNASDMPPSLSLNEEAIKKNIENDRLSDQINTAMIEEEATLYIDVKNKDGNFETAICVKEIAIMQLKEDLQAMDNEE